MRLKYCHEGEGGVTRRAWEARKKTRASHAQVRYVTGSVERNVDDDGRSSRINEGTWVANNLKFKSLRGNDVASVGGKSLG